MALKYRFFCKDVGLRLNYETNFLTSHHIMVYKVPIKSGTPGRIPSLDVKYTGFCHVRYTTHGTNGFKSHSNDEVSWFQDTSAGHRTRTHALLIRNTRA